MSGFSGKNLTVNSWEGCVFTIIWEKLLQGSFGNRTGADGNHLTQKILVVYDG